MNHQLHSHLFLPRHESSHVSTFTTTATVTVTITIIIIIMNHDDPQHYECHSRLSRTQAASVAFCWGRFPHQGLLSKPLTQLPLSKLLYIFKQPRAEQPQPNLMLANSNIHQAMFYKFSTKRRKQTDPPKGFEESVKLLSFTLHRCWFDGCHAGKTLEPQNPELQTQASKLTL